MDQENSVIYGLEFQARVLTPQLAETEKIRFFIGTQSLKQAKNQVHLVDFDEENSTLKNIVYYHPRGEIWRLNSCPHDASLLASCYNSVTGERAACRKKTCTLRVPEATDADQIETLEVVNEFEEGEEDGSTEDVITNEFHPNDRNKCATVSGNQVVLWDTSEQRSRNLLSINLESKSNSKYTIGKWNPHHNCNQFTTATETHLKTYDVRTGQQAWHIDNLHAQLVRDLDFNLNKLYHLATCGDDGFVKIWDFRQTSQPVYSKSDHSHWVWCVRFNPFHDQLLLTASSDARVLLSSAASVSSECTNDTSIADYSAETIESKQVLQDGPLQWFEHEDSIYCAEWSPAEPWVFASLSYDGRLLISRVKKSIKYQIML